MMDQRIKRTKKYVQNHIKERITLKKASKIANISSSYFSSLFRKEMGISFLRYQKLMRIKHAKKLLRKGVFADKEISYELGIRHVSSFCREFKEITGKNPSEYRKRFRILRLFQHVTGGIVKIVHAIVKIANTIVRFVNKIRRNVNRK